MSRVPSPMGAYTSPRGGIGGQPTQRRPLGNNTFSAGELTPRLFGRLDLEKYYQGASKIQNFLVMKQGGAIRRSGTKFVVETADSTKRSRLFSFQAASDQGYVLEFGEFYIRFIRNNAQLLDTGTGLPTQITTPWDADDILDLKFNQSADVLTICHPDFHPHTLSRGAGDDTDPATWTLDVMTAQDGPYLDINTDEDVTITPSGRTGSITLTASSAIFASTDAPSGSNPGRLVRLGYLVRVEGGEVLRWGVVRITAYTAPTVVTALVLNKLPAGYSTMSFDFDSDNADIGNDSDEWRRWWGKSFTIRSFEDKAQHYHHQDGGYIAEDDWFQSAGNIFSRAIAEVFVANSIMAVGINMENSDNYYAARLTTATEVKLIKRKAAAETTLDTIVVALPCTIEVRRVNGLVKLLINEVEEFSGAEDTDMDSDDFGIIAQWTGTDDGAEMAGSRFDNFEGGRADTVVTDVWRLGAWSDTTGYPVCSLYHKDRQWFGGTTLQPHRLDGSRSGDYFSFRPSDLFDDEIDATHAITLLIQDNQLQTIRWLRGHNRGLIVFTTSGMFSFISGDKSEPISALNFTIEKQTTVGIANRPMPFVTNVAMMFTLAGRRKVTETAFSFAYDQFIDADMMSLSEHISRGDDRRLVDQDYQEQPDSTFWWVREDGVLCALTYERSEEVVAWHQHIIGGSDAGAAEVESIAVIRNGSQDQLWMIVKRTIGRSVRRYIERLMPNFGLNGDLEDAFFVDSGLSYDDVATTTISGLDHLEGEEVQVLADGKVVGPFTVNGGVIELSEEASVVHAGLGFDSILRTMPLSQPLGEQVAHGTMRRASDAYIFMHNAVGGQVGYGTIAELDDEDFTRWEPLRSYIYGDGQIEADGDAPALFGGVHKHSMAGRSEVKPCIAVRQTNPLPMTVLSISAYVESGT